MSTQRPRKLVFFIDRIESSSYPVSETGYALVHRAFLRARANGDDIFVVYPNAPFRRSPELTITARRVFDFETPPYQFYRSQREAYHAGEHAGSVPCHVDSDPTEIELHDADALIWRQENGSPERTHALLLELSALEARTPIYQSPRLALDPRFGSKVLPAAIDPRYTPRTFYTHAHGLTSIADKATAAIRFIRETLGDPPTAFVKPLGTNNGVGIGVLGVDPRGGRDTRASEDREALECMLAEHGDVVVQEYIASIRAPEHLTEPLACVPLDRRDFGEIRFLLIDGQIPRTPTGQPIVVARRVPVAGSLVADSGVSHPTTLSVRELAFIEQVGRQYLRWGIYFGGGDLIRTPDAVRPFVFTDAARSVCGHAVVTGALNGQPYLIIDQILDSIDRQIDVRRSHRRTRASARATAWPRSVA